MPVEVLVEYEVVPGLEDDADTVRAAFLEGIASWKPDQMTYRILRKGSEASSFVHLAWVDSRETQQELFTTDFFKAFDVGINRVSGGSVSATPLVEWQPPGGSSR